jgi:hypothetical protein
VNPFGLLVYKNAKLAQFVFHELKDKVSRPIYTLSYSSGRWNVGFLASVYH